MAVVELSFPPGLYANGAPAQAYGRWRDGNLVRFQSGAVRPWGGWTSLASDLEGKARAMVAWTDNAGARWLVVGTSSRLYAIDRLGTVNDITPVGLSAGTDDAFVGGGYGGGAYGEGDYGISDGDDAELVTPATVWSLDTWGEDLVALNGSDGRLYLWERDADAPAVAVTAAGSTATPEENLALVVEETGHVLLLGADGDRRRVQWCDAQDLTQWDAGLPSEAGSFPLQTGGQLMCGRRTRGGTLLLTDQDAWLAVYNGGANPFSFDQVGKGCGVIGQGAAVAAGTSLVVWMGLNGFWSFDGAVSALPSEVHDRVFDGLDRTRASHVTGHHLQEFGEIVWFYPTPGAADNDRYVAFNYRENHWATGALGRTCGCDRGPFSHPLAVDGGGGVWRHEDGFAYPGGDRPYVESGQVAFAAEGEAPGERVFTASELILGESAQGPVDVTLYGRFDLAGEETVLGPFEATPRDLLRFTTRYLRLKLSLHGAIEDAADWRVGGPMRLDIQLEGRR